MLCNYPRLITAVLLALLTLSLSPLESGWAADGVASPGHANVVSPKQAKTRSIEQPKASNSVVVKEPEKISPRQFRERVSSAFRRAAVEKGEARETAIRELVALSAALERDTRMERTERIELLVTIRTRLTKIGRELAKQAKLPGPDHPGVLAQQFGPPGAGANGGQPAAANDHGQELLELIQKTIAPGSWDVQGGLGTIMYWSNMHVLVVRQTDDVHENFEQLIQAIRNPGP